MEIAGDDGIKNLSMRKVAERLGVGTMSLYNYIPSKSELLELMVDAAYADLYESRNTTEREEDWRIALRFIARKNWDILMEHPWVLDAVGGRPILGPHCTLKYEMELQALEGIGLNDIEMDATLSLVLMYGRELRSTEIEYQGNSTSDRHE